MLLKPVFDPQKCRRDIENDLVVGDAATFDDRFQPIDFAVNITAQLTKAQDTQRIADLLEEFELRHKLGRFVHARAYENVEHILHSTQVFTDRGANGLHEFGTWRGQRFARIFYLFIPRQQLGQVERRADLTDACTGSGGTSDVVQKVIQEIVDRVPFVSEQALVNDILQLPIGLTQQAFQCDRRFESTALQ